MKPLLALSFLFAAGASTAAAQTESSTVTHLGYATWSFDLDGETQALLVGESTRGSTDLNGDGDALDQVLFLHDAATGTTTNTGLAVYTAPRVAHGYVVFGVDEAGQAGVDLNGDGDALDVVVHHYEIARRCSRTWASRRATPGPSTAGVSWSASRSPRRRGPT